MRADSAARAYDPRIKEVRASYADELRNILVVASDGTFAEDSQPLARMNVSCIAKTDGNSARGSSGGGGRVALDFFFGEKTPEYFAKEAARQAILQLDAREAPAGEMEVVLGPGWPGVLLARSGRSRTGSGLQSQADFCVRRTDRQARSQREVHRRRQRHHAVASRFAQRGRRRSAHAEHGADRKRNSQGLSERQAFREADGHRRHRQWPPRKLRAHSHAAHDQYLHAGGEDDPARHHSFREAWQSTP